MYVYTAWPIKEYIEEVSNNLFYLKNLEYRYDWVRAILTYAIFFLTFFVTMYLVLNFLPEAILGSKWGSAAKRYSKHMLELYGTMKIFGMTEPIPLEYIYTTVNILNDITSKRRRSVHDLEESFDRDNRSYDLIMCTTEGLELVNDIERIVLLGKPGSGKTTFLKHVVLKAIHGDLNKKRIPVFISLKDFFRIEYFLNGLHNSSI